MEAASHARRGVSGTTYITAGVSTIVGSCLSRIAIAIAVAVITPVVKRGVGDKPRRVEPPAEWAVKHPIARNPSVSREQRVPVPARTIPVRTAASVKAGRIAVGFGEVLRAQTAEAIQVALRVSRLVKLGGLQLAIGFVHLKFVSALDLDVLIAVLHKSFALEDANVTAVGIEPVQAVLQLLCGRAIFLHTQQVILVNFRAFDHGLALG